MLLVDCQVADNQIMLKQMLVFKQRLAGFSEGLLTEYPMT